MDSKRRIQNILLWASLIGIIGLAYALFCIKTGLAIPCPFRTVTGLLCPGCGVTRMCLALLRLDFWGAWNANPGLLLLSPGLLFLLGRLGWRYVRLGHARPTRGENIFIWCAVAAMLAYGVLRNL